jgi:hypothetical protein
MSTIQDCLRQLNKTEQVAYKNIVEMKVSDEFVTKVLASEGEGPELLEALRETLHNEEYMEETFELTGMIASLDFKDFCTYSKKATEVQATSSEYRNKMMREKLKGKIMERLTGGTDMSALLQSGPPTRTAG